MRGTSGANPSLREQDERRCPSSSSEAGGKGLDSPFLDHFQALSRQADVHSCWEEQWLTHSSNLNTLSVSVSAFLSPSLLLPPPPFPSFPLLPSPSPPPPPHPLLWPASSDLCMQHKCSRDSHILDVEDHVSIQISLAPAERVTAGLMTSLKPTVSAGPFPGRVSQLTPFSDCLRLTVSSPRTSCWRES